jgi:hypothetical protein
MLPAWAPVSHTDGDDSSHAYDLSDMSVLSTASRNARTYAYIRSFCGLTFRAGP